MKKAIVVGATSGIGREVAIILSERGYEIGVFGRRENLLQELVDKHKNIVAYKVIDITDDNAANDLLQFVNEMGGIDLYFHSSGIGYQNPRLDAEKELRTVETNVKGFTRMIDAMYNYFAENGGGHIAVISSIAGTKGLGAAPAYSATKRYQNHYIEALSQLSSMRNSKVKFTDIRPGFVATSLLDDGASYPMKMTCDYAAKRVAKTVLKKKKIAIIDWKYAILVFFWRLIPRCIWTRLKIVSIKD